MKTKAKNGRRVTPWARRQEEATRLRRAEYIEAMHRHNFNLELKAIEASRPGMLRLHLPTFSTFGPR